MTIKMRINNATGYGDLVMGDRGIATDGSLETVAQTLTHCDRTAGPNDKLPEGSDDRRGWWGDALDENGFKLGSRVWLVPPKATNTNRRLAADYVEEAVEPLVELGVAQAARSGPVELRRGDTIAIATEFLEPGDPAPRWVRYWQEFDLGLA